MDLQIFFQPIDELNSSQESMGFLVDSYNNTDCFPDWEIANVVIISINDNRGANEEFHQRVSHVQIREHFYNFKFDKDIKIADLGIVEAGAKISDTYSALIQITEAIQKKSKFLIVLGGSQDLTYANYLGYEKLEQTVNLTCIDSHFDVKIDQNEGLNSNNFINHLLLHHPNFLFNFSIMGFHHYYVGEQQLRFFDDLYFDYIRLGELQIDLKKMEPFLRNTDILSLDLGSLRNSDFQSAFRRGPNGFFANEICQMMKYAGLSDKLSSVGIYNYNSQISSNVDAELIAQFLYFLISGYSERKKDFPVGNKKEHLKYSVFHDELKHNLVFHKSLKSDRWWLEVPYPPLKDFKFDRHHLVPCDYNDYLIAQKGIIPDLWWKTYRKLN